MTSKALGDFYESKALEYLKKNGLKLLDRNFYSRFGEIDLLMLESKTLCFIEVKARKNNSFGKPEEFVNLSKQKKLIATAQYFLQTHTKYQKNDCRFDVIAITPKGDALDVNWIKNAFMS